MRADRAQLVAVRQLNALHRELVHGRRMPGLIARLLGRRPGQGLYLWGGVGTGKTLLMDVFYRALPARLGKRIHYHRFMQWVHDKKTAST